MTATLAMTGATLVERMGEFFSFHYEFATLALLASVLVGAVCGVVGSFLVLRGMALLGDAVGHATLPGVCVAFLLVGSKMMGALLLGALASGLLAAVAVGALSNAPRTRPDAAVGIVLSGFFGAGIVLLSYLQNSPTGAQSGLSHFLYGNAAGVTWAQLAGLTVVALLLIGGVILGFRALALTTFDPGFARSIGMPVNAVHNGLLLALALAVVVAIQAVGVVLVAAMLIIPPSAALLHARTLPGTLIAAGIIGGASGALGAFVSFLFEGVSTGPAMVLVATAVFAFALALPRRGATSSSPPTAAVATGGA